MEAQLSLQPGVQGVTGHPALGVLDTTFCVKGVDAQVEQVLREVVLPTLTPATAFQTKIQDLGTPK